MEKISACLVVYNEEKLIRRCLESLRDVVDEIILVHDGECTDRTLEIAKEYGAKIFVRDHKGFCEHHRPFCCKQASYNWILQIDADEFLSAELRNNLRSLVSNQEVSAYELLWPFWDGKKEIKGN
jgi:glycosyltransferase involved in cell wall biosynthesis